MLRRRKWILLLSIVVVPAAAVLYSLHEPAKYQASADVLLGGQSTIAALAGTQNVPTVQDPQRNIDTQAVIAREPEVAQRVLAALHLHDRTAQDFLDASSVSSLTDTDVLTLRVTDRNRALAAKLATAYATQFAGFSRELDTNAIQSALSGVRKRLSLIPSNARGSQYYSSLIDREAQLQTALALTSNASVVRVATTASQVQPTPVRNGLFGLVIGLVLGAALVFFREALDTRVRAAEEVRSALHLPLLARIPRPPRRIRNDERLVMVASPADLHSEPFRVLRTNLEFANLEKGARTIMVTSAVEEEGKSTTVANLAVAFARSGKSVVLVDLDLRRPVIHRFFRCNSRPGLTEVALGHTTLERALIAVDAVSGTPVSQNGPVSAVVLKPQTPKGSEDASDLEQTDEILLGVASGNGRQPHLGSLFVLPAGPLPPDPGEFVASTAVKAILDRLKSKADVVLIDSPPALQVGDALTLSALVDGIMVVSRLDALRRRTLTELHRVLDACPAEKLGVVVAGAQFGEDYAYTYSGYYTEVAEQKLRVLQ